LELFETDVGESYFAFHKVVHIYYSVSLGACLQFTRFCIPKFIKISIFVELFEI